MVARAKAEASHGAQEEGEDGFVFDGVHVGVETLEAEERDEDRGDVHCSQKMRPNIDGLVVECEERLGRGKEGGTVRVSWTRIKL
jgi:hypothetical protein